MAHDLFCTIGFDSLHLSNSVTSEYSNQIKSGFIRKKKSKTRI